MNDREYPVAVQAQLQKEGFDSIKKFSRNRFYATSPNGKVYDFRVKYCIKPRKLYAIDVGYMTGLTRKDIPSVLVTNGVDITKKHVIISNQRE
jgi:hypothetical protein